MPRSWPNILGVSVSLTRPNHPKSKTQPLRAGLNGKIQSALGVADISTIGSRDGRRLGVRFNVTVDHVL